MTRPDRSHPGRGAWRRRLAVGIGLLLVAAGAGAAYWRLDPETYDLQGIVAPGPDDQASPSPPGPAASVLGVTLPSPAAAAPVAQPVERAEAGTPDPVAVRRALADVLRDPALGPHVVVRVSGLSDGPPGFSAGTSPIVPASTLKLLTAAAALEVLGPDHVFETRVVQGGGNRIVLVGGGDPTLASTPRSGPGFYPVRPDLRTLASATADALTPGATVRLSYDDSLFSGPAVSTRWEPDYVPDGVVAPITALWADGGRPPSGFGRVEDPSAAAARVFARALERRGIDVAGPPRPGRAPGAGSELASLPSAPLERIVERVLEVSDNEASEALLRHVGLAHSGAGTFAGGLAGLREVLGSLGVPLERARLYDGSGLSRANRLDPALLVAVLRLAADPGHPALRPLLTGLPVAGATGSLLLRFESPAARPGRGLVRAKTGTLSGVSSLAGLVTDREGGTLAFVVAADRFAVEDTLAARAALDRLAAELAACRCTAG